MEKKSEKYLDSTVKITKKDFQKMKQDWYRGLPEDDVDVDDDEYDEATVFK